MTEKEIIAWLGFTASHKASKRHLVPEIIDGMKDVPNPICAREEVDAFRIFLMCAPIPQQAIFLPETERWPGNGVRVRESRVESGRENLPADRPE